MSLFQPHFPLFQSFPAVVLNFCPLLLVDDGILAVQGCHKPLQIWPAASEAVCKTFLAIKKKEKDTLVGEDVETVEPSYAADGT